MAANPLIAVRNVTKRYGRKPVLRGVDLLVHEGQVTALLGANGAGKTTLMRVISGLTKPERGEITLGGVSYATAGHELRRYVGMVGHASLLYDNLSAEENLAFFASLYDVAEPGARIESVLRAVDLWTRRRDPVRTYSRGMTQRLAIARAILHDPPVLLLDEPDTGLDQASAAMLRDLLADLGASNRAILFSTHHLERAIEWADSVCLLVGGRMALEQATAGLSVEQLRDLYETASRAA